MYNILVNTFYASPPFKKICAYFIQIKCPLIKSWRALTAFLLGVALAIMDVQVISAHCHSYFSHLTPE